MSRAGDVDEAAAGDLALLRAFEPVIRYTAGELFLPAAVEGYVARASLWEFPATGRPSRLVEAGGLSIDRLVDEAVARPRADLSLQFVERPLDRRALRAWRRRPDRPRLRSQGRFTEVGLLSRMIDAVFRLALLLRGRVPGGLAAAAEQVYRRELGADHHPYYGRVVREGGYVALHYWYFYAMNDWRSNFGGANDHEADWEQVLVYLAPGEGGELRPAWVAFSAHDEVGDDLRRRWDDPDLVREGDHPVVFAGAGSHSGAFIAGEYVTAVNPPAAMRPLFTVMRAVAKVIAPWSRGEIARGVGIPFVDYARGDGEVIGPGHPRGWSPVLIGDETPWVRHFRGLWGLDTRDRFGGERAPAGPRYERGGTVRQSWADPLGWAGLQKVPATAAEAEALVRQRLGQVDERLAALDEELAEERRQLRQLAAEAASLQGRQELEAAASARRAQVAEAERGLRRLAQERAGLADERAAHLDSLAHGLPQPPPQAHLRHRSLPVDRQPDQRRTTFLKVWSTVSTPLFFLAAAWLLVDQRFGVVAGVTTFAVAFLTVEALARGRLVAFAVSVLGVVIGVLVGVAVVQAILGRWQVVVAALLGIAAGAVLVANLRDLRRG